MWPSGLWFCPLSPVLPLVLPGYSGSPQGRGRERTRFPWRRSERTAEPPCGPAGMVRSLSCFRLSRSPAAGCLVCPFFLSVPLGSLVIRAAVLSPPSAFRFLVSPFLGRRRRCPVLRHHALSFLPLYFFPLISPFGIFALLFSPRPHSCSRLPIPDHPSSSCLR